MLVANWKLNPPGVSEAVRLAKMADRNGVVICPPFVFLSRIKKVLRRAALGAQDVFWEEGGAYTGEVSPMMLKNLGTKYVIIGHSERRRWLNETDEMVNKKIKAALHVGLKVILCVGEPLAVRRRGLAAAKNFVKSQLLKDLADIQKSKIKNLKLKIVVTYEPIWAISGGQYGHITDKPEDVVEMARFIKNFLLVSCRLSHVAVLYGGSVNGKNAESFLQYNEIDGALVGGASLKVGEFKKIIKIVSNYG